VNIENLRKNYVTGKIPFLCIFVLQLMKNRLLICFFFEKFSRVKSYWFTGLEIRHQEHGINILLPMTHQKYYSCFPIFQLKNYLTGLFFLPADYLISPEKEMPLVLSPFCRV
jgi:hypothetical protein